MPKRERLKVYHGLPKSPVDNTTILYVGFDGKLEADIGSMTTPPNSSYYYMPTPTGLGLCFNGVNFCRYTCTEPLTAREGTIEFWINPSQFQSEADWSIPISVLDSNGRDILFLCFNKAYKNLYIQENYTNGGNLTTGSTNSLILNYAEDVRHLRMCWDNDYLYLYSNGVLVARSSKRQSESVRYTPNGVVTISRSTGSNKYSSVICDLQISKLCKGSYFNNLPKDVIESKAIVRPKMGQQQIKGDPLCSQETTDVVKIGDNVNEPQITCSRTTGNWTSGDTIKIKGLNKESISGVIDSDTTLCRIMQNGTFVSENPLTVVVNDTSKIAVGDLVRCFRASTTKKISGMTPTVIEKTNNTIVLDYGIKVMNDLYAGDYFVEVTTSTSSPIVKSSTGGTVTGNWSNLGTSEATFTLGTNANLTNEDLYITYSLNIAPGNSDYTELPYSVEVAYDELGNELEEVSQIVIEDDFKGKIAKSTDECPHMYNWSSDATLLTPTKLEGNTSNIQTYYDKLSSKDNVLESMTVGTLNGIPQQLFSFNILDIIRRKLNNKNITLAWIKSNITKITFNHVGYCTNDTTFDRLFAKYDYTNNKWLYVRTVSTTQSSLSQVVINPEFYEINNEGIVSFLVYGGASNGSSNSTVFTDYVSIELSIKHDQNYLAMFSVNKRARELPCNPILIQKETKTIKRYFPSKECFSTEILYSKPKAVEVSITDQDILYRLPIIYLTTQGTGNYNSTALDTYRECVAKLGIPLSKDSYNYLNEILTEYSNILGEYCPIRFMTSLSDNYYTNNYLTLPVGDYFKKANRCLTLKPYIIQNKGEIYLLVVVREFSYGVQKMTKHYKYTLSNRPLIK